MKQLLSLLILIIYSSTTFSQEEKSFDKTVNPKEDIELKLDRTKTFLNLVALSKSLAPIEVILYDRKDNKELKSILVDPGKSSVLLKVSNQQSDSLFAKKIKDSVRIAYYPGHKSLIQPDLDYPYRLPFKKGKKYEVTQSFKGKFSHNSLRSNFAIDFNLAVGETVCAARGGKVIKVIDWFTERGGKELINAANKIVILHEDGTLASYVHLDYQGSYVKEGETVEKGQKIGVSGVTGFTRGPHLHFVIRKERDISIPIYFEGYENKILKKGKRYKVIE